jgi:hypothetical protein
MTESRLVREVSLSQSPLGTSMGPRSEERGMSGTRFPTLLRGHCVVRQEVAGTHARGGANSFLDFRWKSKLQQIFQRLNAHLISLEGKFDLQQSILSAGAAAPIDYPVSSIRQARNRGGDGGRGFEDLACLASATFSNTLTECTHALGSNSSLDIDGLPSCIISGPRRS